MQGKLAETNVLLDKSNVTNQKDIVRVVIPVRVACVFMATLPQVEPSEKRTHVRRVLLPKGAWRHYATPDICVKVHDGGQRPGIRRCIPSSSQVLTVNQQLMIRDSTVSDPTPHSSHVTNSSHEGRQGQTGGPEVWLGGLGHGSMRTTDEANRHWGPDHHGT